MEELYRIILFISGIILLLIAGYTYSQRRITYMIGLPGFCISGALYAIGYSIELGVITLDQFYFALKLEYIGICTLPIFIIILILEVIDRREWIHFRSLLWMSLLPLLTYVLVFTAPYHHLYYKSVTLNSVSGLTIAALDKAFWYYPFVVYINVLFLATLLFLLYLLVKARDDLKKLYGFLFLALFLPVLGSTAYYTGLTPYQIDPSPSTLIFTSLVILYGLNQDLLITISNKLRERIFDYAPMMILVINRHHKVIDYNESLLKTFQLHGDDIIGKPVEESLKGYSHLIEYILTTDDVVHRLPHCGPRLGLRSYTMTEYGSKIVQASVDAGLVGYFKVTKAIIYNPFGRMIGQYIALDDVTNESKMMKRLDHMAKHDSLTGLLNRSSFYALSNMQITKADTGDWMSLLMIDIDHFKLVNDQYGHLAGDVVLKRLSGIFNEHVRETDLVGRFGGEEFVLFMAGAGAEISQRLAERIRSLVENTNFEYQETQIHITVSIGIAVVAKLNDLRLEDMMDSADQAMYAAKNKGRNRVEIGSVSTKL